MSKLDYWFNAAQVSGDVIKSETHLQTAVGNEREADGADGADEDDENYEFTESSYGTKLQVAATALEASDSLFAEGNSSGF